MGSFSTIGGGVTKLSELTIDANANLAPTVGSLAHLFEQNDTGNVAEFIELLGETALLAKSIDNANLTAAKAASIVDNANLTAAKAASICDSANITSAKIKAILDTGSLTVADKIAALLDGDSLTAADAATHVNSGTYTDALMASAFDSSYLAASKAASIVDNANLTEAKLQSILYNTNLTIQKGQEIVDAMSSPSKIGTGGRRGYIGDDWSDNKITSRDNAATVATALSKIYQKFRPEWSIENIGTSSDPYADSGQLVFLNDVDNTGQKGVYTSLNTNTGTFKIKFKQATTTTDNSGVCPIQICSSSWVSGGEGYDLMYRTDGSEYTLWKGRHNTAIISSTWDGDTAWHEAKITRDSSGNFELFYDGVSKGTATDTDYTSFNTLEVFYTNGVQIDTYFDDLEVF